MSSKHQSDALAKVVGNRTKDSEGWMSLGSRSNNEFLRALEELCTAPELETHVFVKDIPVIDITSIAFFTCQI